MKMKQLTKVSLIGDDICQCCRCKEFFADEESFDEHLKGSAVNSSCDNPESVGLKIKEVKDGTAWSKN